jgi:hypothetical protein
LFRRKIPNFDSEIKNHIIDTRKNQGKKYSTKDLILSALCIFIFKEGSRNAYNLDIDQPFFKRNIQNALKFKLAHADTIDDFFRDLDHECLHKLKTSLIQTLISTKVFEHGMLNGKYIVAIDGTQTGIYEEHNSDGALKKESKNGVISYARAVLEAKLVTKTGFCISLGSVWIENENEKYDKQDCEKKAFKRLAEQIKKDYPQLPIILVLDALFASEPVISICKENDWNFFIVQKNNFSKFLLEEINLCPGKKTVEFKHKKFSFLNDIEYQKGMYVNWFTVTDESECFKSSWITDLNINKNSLILFETIARLRWKIENEGFNIQKNHGYKLEHKYNRNNLKAIKNFYQCIQIAAIFEQLVFLDIKTKKIMKKITKIKAIEWCKAMLIMIRFKIQDIEKLVSENTVFAYIE